MKKTIYTLGASLLFITLSLNSSLVAAQSQTGEDRTTEAQKESPSAVSDNGQQIEQTTKRNIPKTDKSYKTDRRNKKASKLKYDNCEAVESEKGASNSEVKMICTPKP